MDNIKVSVVMPAYNAEKFIDEAIESVFLQTLPGNVEIIVVLDGGSDNTKGVVQRAMNRAPSNRELILVENELNVGVAESRNIGIEIAKGEYIAFLDADDYWDVGKLDKQIKVFEGKSGLKNKKDLKVVYSSRELIDEQSKSLGKVIRVPEYTDYKSMLKTNSINCSSALIVSDIAKSLKMDHPELAEDYIYWLRLLKSGGYAYGIKEPLLKYRVSKSSKGGNKVNAAKMHFGCYKVIGVTGIRAVFYFCCYAINGVIKYR